MDPLQRIGALDPNFPPVTLTPPLRRTARDQQSPPHDDPQRRHQPPDQTPDETARDDDAGPGPHIDISA
jgi:hypothetical protein